MYVPSGMAQYVCPECRNKIPAADLETVFHEQLRDFFLSPEEMAKHLTAADDALKRQEDLITVLEAERKKLAVEMDKLYDLYQSGAIDNDEAICDLDAAAFLSRSRTRFRRVRPRRQVQAGAPSGLRRLLRCEARAPALLYLCGQVPHGLLCDHAAFAARERGLRRIDRCQNLRTGTLPPLPQGHGLADGVFYAAQPSTRDGIADKCFLVGGQIYGHEIQRTSERMGGQGKMPGHFAQ
jgi:hypothetical protein